MYGRDELSPVRRTRRSSASRRRWRAEVDTRELAAERLINAAQQEAELRLALEREVREFFELSPLSRSR